MYMKQGFPWRVVERVTFLKTPLKNYKYALMLMTNRLFYCSTVLILGKALMEGWVGFL